MNGWAQFLVGILAVVGGVLTTWLTVRRAGKRDRIDTTQQFIDQMQENAAAAEERHHKQITALRKEVVDVKSRMDDMEDRELVAFDYIYDLRHAIDQRREPPPPPWPEALLRRRRA
jgi:hypothetical protein